MILRLPRASLLLGFVVELLVLVAGIWSCWSSWRPCHHPHLHSSSSLHPHCAAANGDCCCAASNGVVLLHHGCWRSAPIEALLLTLLRGRADSVSEPCWKRPRDMPWSVWALFLHRKRLLMRAIMPLCACHATNSSHNSHNCQIISILTTWSIGLNLAISLNCTLIGLFLGYLILTRPPSQTLPVTMGGYLKHPFRALSQHPPRSLSMSHTHASIASLICRC